MSIKMPSNSSSEITLPELSFRPGEKELYFTFKRPAVAATVIVLDRKIDSRLSFEKMNVLIIVRSDKAVAAPSEYAFPGGFLNTDIETLEQCAARELYEETNICIYSDDLKLFAVTSEIVTDNRAHVINVFYVCVLDKKCEVYPGDDAVAAFWVNAVSFAKENNMAFDHLEKLQLFLKSTYNELHTT
jgi:ADP-ribose pyrophosphatase YjhB (NUDIX family)